MPGFVCWSLCLMSKQESNQAVSTDINSRYTPANHEHRAIITQLSSSQMSWFTGKPAPKRTLTVSASTDYTATPQIIPVNTEKPITIESSLATIDLLVRINGFAGSSEHGSSPPQCEYFDKRSGTNISIQLAMTPKASMDGSELLFGNDFAYPIKDSLPYGTSTGFRLFKSYVDPSVDGDLYAEEPFLYGKALSSFNVINDKIGKVGDDHILEEDLSNDGEMDLGDIPTTSSKRQRFFQSDDHLKQFEFMVGKTYHFDFFSGLLSLKDGDFQISLPGGFEVNLSNYLNEKFDSVRYVLKKSSDDGEMGVKYGEPLLVITFQLDTSIDNDNDNDNDNDEAGLEVE